MHLHDWMTGSYLHHDDCCPNYICDVYHNECVTHSRFDLNTTDNLYHLSPQLMLKDKDYEALQHYLLWLPIDCTLDTTTQWLCNAYHIPFCKHFKSCFPADSVSHQNEPIATDTMFSDQATLGRNAQAAQKFIGCNSKYIDVYGVVTDQDLSHTLEENIMSCGAMDVLISNNALRCSLYVPH